MVVEMPYPTDDVRLLTKTAVEAAERVFRQGFNYSNAEVSLLDLRQSGDYSGDLFAPLQSIDATKIMTVLDEINQRWGRGTLRPASVLANPVWGMRREFLSKSYTTRLDHPWVTSCR